MFLFGIELLVDLLKRFGWNIAKSAVDVTQNGNERIPRCTMFFNGFFYNDRNITFNYWGNHQSSVKRYINDLRFNSNGIEVTNLYADAATDTGLIIDVMNLSSFPADGIDRAVARTDRATSTYRFLDFHADQRATNFCRAAFFVNMR